MLGRAEFDCGSGTLRSVPPVDAKSAVDQRLDVKRAASTERKCERVTGQCERALVDKPESRFHGMNLLKYFRCFWDEWNFLYWEDSDEGLKRRRRIRSVKANSRPRAAGKASESEIHRRCYRAAMPEPSHLLPTTRVSRRSGICSRNLDLAAKEMERRLLEMGLALRLRSYCERRGRTAQRAAGSLARGTARRRLPSLTAHLDSSAPTAPSTATWHTRARARRYLARSATMPFVCARAMSGIWVRSSLQSVIVSSLPSSLSQGSSFGWSLSVQARWTSARQAPCI